MSEHFDSTVGARTIYMPFGGKYQHTPAISMAALLPSKGSTDTATVAAFGFNPYLMEESCFTGAVYSVLMSASKLVASGADPSKIRLTFQEYFMRLRNDPKRWGQPLSALLGALYAQMGLKLPSIGGKDSMSGSFEDIDVPNTLISFALAPARADELITNVLTEKTPPLYALSLKIDEYGVPDLDYASRLYTELHGAITAGKVEFATVVDEGGTFAAVAKSCFGNFVGFDFYGGVEELLIPKFGELIVSLNDENDLGKEFEKRAVGRVSGSPKLTIGKTVLSLNEALKSYTGKLEGIFASSKQTGGSADALQPSKSRPEPRPQRAELFARPRVLIPVFPGTNCEHETARSFELAGAEVEELLIRNMTPADIEEACRKLAESISRCQIIAFPGGFSGGDEPDGSGKFIATTFKNPRVRDSVTELLRARDGLMLGICNGFQALIKLGLVPYGGIIDLDSSSPTLSFNSIGRHVSQLVNVKVLSASSPWLSGVKAGEVYTIAVSHGEGRFVCGDAQLEGMLQRGQIATQYVDSEGNATMLSPFNPNGAKLAVEGITSGNGRIFGRMGHSERIGKHLYKNCEGNFDMKIFESGVGYFR